MNPDIYVDQSKIRIGKRVGKGGEGEVYALQDDSTRALKIYTVKDAQSREPKLKAMVKARIAEKSNLVAFPVSIAKTGDGRFAGFVMRLVEGHKPLYQLYAPSVRKTNFPQVDYRFLIRTAANIAKAVAAVQKTGCVVGDINNSCFLVSDKALVALIDADSFQYHDGNNNYKCHVGTPGYIPPELMGQQLGSVLRTVNHDAFGLAVIIFQLLFMGRHPYTGRYNKGEITLEEAIADSRFAYSLKRNVGMTPPPGVPQLSDFPTPIVNAFEAAFEPNAQNRPTADQWITLLAELESSLRSCREDKQHFHASPSARCPWCHMEQTLGIALFVPYFDLSLNSNQTTDPGAVLFNLEKLWQEIEAVLLPSIDSITPTLEYIKFEPSEKARAIQSNCNKSRVFGFFVIATAIFFAILSPSLLLVWGVLAIFGFTKLIAVTETNHLRNKYVAFQHNWEIAEEDWRKRVGCERLFEYKSKLKDAKNSYENLPYLEKERIDAYQSKRRERHLQEFLEHHPIRRAKIKGIGDARQATLNSYGIETAADVTKSRVLMVPGFGENNSLPLLAWRQKIESSFVYHDKQTPSDQQELNRIKSELAAEGVKLRRELTSGAKNLARLAQAVNQQIKLPDPVLQRLQNEQDQLEADMAFLRVPIPPPLVKNNLKAARASAPLPSTRTQSAYGSAATPSSSTHIPQTSTVPRCPQCGGSMVRRKARKGPNAGGFFYGCARFPNCRGTRSI